MDEPKILLIGAHGQVGWQLRRTLAPLGRVLAVGRRELDLTDLEMIRRLVQQDRPALIVNAAAYTAVDKAESETALAQRINAEAPGVLAESAKQVDAWLLHYSTDYVFDGTKAEPYLEADIPNPVGAYGRTKLAGEQRIQEVDGKHLIFRLCWVYGERGNNFMLTIQRLAQERTELKVVNDQIGCPTWSRQIAEASTLALQQVLSGSSSASKRGIYHIASVGFTSWHGFATKIIEWMPEKERRCQELKPISTKEYPTAARRPAYSVLECNKLKEIFKIQLPHWEDQLKLVLER